MSPSKLTSLMFNARWTVYFTEIIFFFEFGRFGNAVHTAVIFLLKAMMWQIETNHSKTEPFWKTRKFLQNDLPLCNEKAISWIIERSFICGSHSRIFTKWLIFKIAIACIGCTRRCDLGFLKVSSKIRSPIWPNVYDIFSLSINLHCVVWIIVTNLP